MACYYELLMLRVAVFLERVVDEDIRLQGILYKDGKFRFDQTLPGYVFNLKTTGLTTGTYRMNFSISGDPLPHFVTFGVK